MTAAKQASTVSLDVQAMTDMQLVRELGKLHYELSDRLYKHYFYGANPNPDDLDEWDADPARLDQGLLLGSRLDEMATQFREGPLVSPDGDTDHFGIDRTYNRIRKAVTRFDQQAEEVAS